MTLSNFTFIILINYDIKLSLLFKNLIFVQVLTILLLLCFIIVLVIDNINQEIIFSVWKIEYFFFLNREAFAFENFKKLTLFTKAAYLSLLDFSSVFEGILLVV